MRHEHSDIAKMIVQNRSSLIIDLEHACNAFFEEEICSCALESLYISMGHTDCNNNTIRFKNQVLSYAPFVCDTLIKIPRSCEYLVTGTTVCSLLCC